MKRIGLLATAVLVLGLAVIFASCGGGGGGSGSGSSAPSTTPISTPAQGAQSATAAVSTFRSMSSAGNLLTGMAGLGTPAPQIKTPFAAGPASTAADKFAARFAPAAKKAGAMRSSAARSPQTSSCYGGGTMTTDMDAAGTSMTMTFDNCKEGDTLTDGTVVINGISQDSNSGSGNITVGSAAQPFVATTYSSPTSTVINEVIKAVVGMTFTATGTSATDMSFTLSINGYFDDVDYVAHTHEKQDMANLSVRGGLGSTETIGNVSYDVATLTLNGTVTGTTYASDTGTAVSYQEGPNTFTNVVIVDKYPSFGAGDEYLTIDGTFSVSTTPADRCIDGTFSIATNTPLQIDSATGRTKAGKVTINGNVVATFNSDDSVSVSLDGGAAVVYSRTELDSLCAL